MEEEQQGKCGICKESKKLFVDHCHKTRKVRGLLCSKCNLIIGQLNDSVEVGKNLVKYLEDTKDD